MSKYMDEFENRHKNIGNLKRLTKQLIRKGNRLAMEQYHDAKSLKRLKEKIRN